MTGDMLQGNLFRPGLDGICEADRRKFFGAIASGVDDAMGFDFGDFLGHVR